MKKFFATAVIAALCSTDAPAADVAARPVYAKASMTAPVSNWTGCYAGGNIGGGRTETTQQRIGQTNGFVFNPPDDYGSDTGTNLVGGGQIGCDYQIALGWVVGVQGMADFGHIAGSHALPMFPIFQLSSTTKEIYTATVRAGYLVAPQLLGYVKGGGAWAKADSVVTVPTNNNFLSEYASGISRSGWTIGGGLEWMFAPGWSVFGEYNYMDFGTKNVTYAAGPLTAPGSPGDIVPTRLTAQQALIGLNYKFRFGGTKY